jgi:hypothetical protein
VEAKRALDPQNEPVRPAGPCALGPAEMDVPAECVAQFALAFHPLDAATALRAQPPFQAQTGDGH